jgi:MFS transporter, DHA1 family, multidrug resistance protein
VPETLAPAQRHGASVAATARRMSDLAREWNFSKHITVTCLVTFGFFTYIGGSSFVLQSVYGISGPAFALLFSVDAATMVVGSVAFRLAVPRYGPRTLRAGGIAAATAAALALLAAARLSPQDRPPLSITWLLLATVTWAMGLTLPASMTLAQQAGERFRGTASSLQGGLSLLAGAIASPMTGLFGDNSLLPMAALMSAGFAAGAVVLVVISRRDAGRQKPATEIRGPAIEPSGASSSSIPPRDRVQPPTGRSAPTSATSEP